MKQNHTLFAPKGIAIACLLVLLFISSCGVRRGRKGTSDDPREPLKREFRATWLPTIFRSDYARRTREEVRELLTKRIELLKQTGCNVLIFQIRAEGDAWYPSELEPWSRYLTGAQGQAPEPSWDPLGFVINECHTRGIEVHAWMNPYRGAANADQELDSKHPARRFPELYVRYGKQLVMILGIHRVFDISPLLYVTWWIAMMWMLSISTTTSTLTQRMGCVSMTKLPSRSMG